MLRPISHVNQAAPERPAKSPPLNAPTSEVLSRYSDHYDAGEKDATITEEPMPCPVQASFEALQSQVDKNLEILPISGLEQYVRSMENLQQRIKIERKLASERTRKDELDKLADDASLLTEVLKLRKAQLRFAQLLITGDGDGSARRELIRYVNKKCDNFEKMENALAADVAKIKAALAQEDRKFRTEDLSTTERKTSAQKCATLQSHLGRCHYCGYRQRNLLNEYQTLAIRLTTAN